MKTKSTNSKPKVIPATSRAKQAPKGKASPVGGDKGVSRGPAKKATPVANAPQQRAHANTTRRAGKAKAAPSLSCLQAAEVVLADAPVEGWSTKEIVERMAAKKLWSSPNGKTPEATLYGGIVREIERKREAARFLKVGRGRFTLRPSGD